MVIRAGIDLTSEFYELGITVEDFVEATRRVLRSNPELKGHFQLNSNDTRFMDSSNDLSEAICQKVWEYNDIRLNDFLSQSISAQSSPLFRFRYKAGEGLHVAAHHALFDGRGISALLVSIFVAVLNLNNSQFVAPTLTQIKSKTAPLDIYKGSFFKRLISAFHNVRLRIIGFLFPPVLLGPKDSLFGAIRNKMSLTFTEMHIQSLFEGIKNKYIFVTRNDYYMTCLHLAVQDSLHRQMDKGIIFGGSNRISIMMPIDFRGKRERLTLPFANLSSAVPIYSFTGERKNPTKLLRVLSKRSLKLRQLRMELQSLKTLKLIKTLGVFDASRKTLIAQGLPRRAVYSAKGFWRFSDTGIMTNMGEIRGPMEATKFVTKVTGYIPPLPPMGMTMCIAEGFGTTFSVQSSEATMSKVETEWLMSRFAYWIEELPKLVRNS